jgi:hypothetical protein
MQPGLPRDLIRVGVADPGDKVGRVRIPDLTAEGAQSPLELLQIDVQGVRPHLVEGRDAPGVARQVELTHLLAVDVAQVFPRLGEMQGGVDRSGLLRPRGAQLETAAEFRIDRQRERGAREVEEQELAPAMDLAQQRAGEQPDEPFAGQIAQDHGGAFGRQRHGLDPTAAEAARQDLAHDFQFRELGHGARSVACRPDGRWCAPYQARR